jgi:hypothetical protein
LRIVFNAKAQRRKGARAQGQSALERERIYEPRQNQGMAMVPLIAYIVLCIWSQVVRRLPSARSSEYAGKSVIVRAVQGNLFSISL